MKLLKNMVVTLNEEMLRAYSRECLFAFQIVCSQNMAMS